MHKICFRSGLLYRTLQLSGNWDIQLLSMFHLTRRLPAACRLKRSCNFSTDYQNCRQNSDGWTVANFRQRRLECCKYQFCPEISTKCAFFHHKLIKHFWTSIFRQGKDFLTILFWSQKLEGDAVSSAPASAVTPMTPTASRSFSAPIQCPDQRFTVINDWYNCNRPDWEREIARSWSAWTQQKAAVLTILHQKTFSHMTTGRGVVPTADRP